MACGVLVLSRVASAAVVNSTWNGGSGNWSTAGNWTPAVVPNNAADTYEVNIFGSLGDGSSVTLDISPTVDRVSVGLFADLSFAAGQTLTIAGGTLNNLGGIDLGSSGRIRWAGSLVASGVGGVSAETNLAGFVPQAGGGSLTIPLGKAIRGPVSLGDAVLMAPVTITNGGLIDAIHSATDERTIIVPSAIGVFNAGIMRARGNGRLALRAGNYDNTDGLIELTDNGLLELENGVSLTGGTVRNNGAAPPVAVQITPGVFVSQVRLEAVSGSAIRILEGVTITGGTFASSTGGAIQITNNGTLAGTPTAALVNVTNEGLLQLGQPSSGVTPPVPADVTLVGTLTNNGTIEYTAGTGSFSAVSQALYIDGTATLSGSGKLLMQSGLTNGIRPSGGTALLINGSSHAIEGVGSIITGLRNQGLLDVRPSPNASTFNIFAPVLENHGTMRASLDGVLNLFGGVGITPLNNGTIVADGASARVSVTGYSGITGTGQWIADGGTVTINSVPVSTTGAVTVRNGGRLILNSSSLGGNLHVESSGGTVVLSGSHLTGAVVVEAAGVLQVSGTSSAGGLSGAGSVTFATGTQFTADHFRLNLLRAGSTAGVMNVNLSVRPNGTNAGTSRVGLIDLGIPDVGTLDLADNDLVVDYDQVSQFSTIRSYITFGYNGGAWNGANIRSSLADATTFGLGYGEASAVFGSFPADFSGQSVDDTSVLVRYTFYGDADLDGDVDVADLGRLASSWQTATFWTGGDFNYSGFVDVADLGLLASNWQAGVSLTNALAAFGLSGVSVPEPACLGFVSSIALCLASRRRRIG